MFNNLNNFIKKFNNIYWLIWIRRTLNTAPLFETFFWILIIIIRIALNEAWDHEYYFKYETPFYDTGSMISFLICLEHLYVCYYLIIILIMVYWFLYLCIIDFSGWSFKNKGLLFVLYYNILNINKYIILLLNKGFILIYKIYYLIKEINYLHFNLNRVINYKTNNLLKNNIPIYNNLNNQFDLLGRSYLLFNLEIIKYWKNINLILETKNLLNLNWDNIKNLYLKKTFTKYLFYTNPKSFFFFLNSNNILTLNKNNSINLNMIIINLRSFYKDIFITNNFKHSGIFEAVWAIFPTIIIICILIPSLILLYSFEDILNPKLSIKVIGNQWYWTYEFDNWIQFKQINNIDIYNISNKNNFDTLKNNLFNYSDTFINKSNKIWDDFYLIKKLIKDTVWIMVSNWFIEWNIYYNNYHNFKNLDILDPYKMHEIYLNEYNYINQNKELYFKINENIKTTNIKNIYTNYAFNSVIIPQDDLIYGTKRLLECDNRLVLPTNLTIRFLITSADVLHAFAMPELGFKVDAVPGRLNQILIFINRPGVFYGQCSELCGANHAFMPIVIQSVLPDIYLSYIENIQLKSDLKI